MIDAPLQGSRKDVQVLLMREPAVYGKQRVETVVRSKAPFPVPTHPIWGTIRISQAAGKDVRSGRGTDSSSSSLILLAGEYQPGSFQHRDRLIPGHRWEVPKEIVEPVARFQVLHEYAHGDPCAGEHRRATQDVGIPVDRFVVHGRLRRRVAGAVFGFSLVTG